MRHDDIIPPAHYLEHAKRELRALGYEVDNPERETKEVNREMAASILALVQLFAAQGYSRESARYANTAVALLCGLMPLTPLRGSEDEWSAPFADGLQQNLRHANVLRNNEGKSIHLGAIVYVDPLTAGRWQDDTCTVDVTFPYDPKLTYETKAIPRKSALEAGVTHRPIITSSREH